MNKLLIQVLLYIWFPFSVGLIDGMNADLGGGVTIQHLLMMLIILIPSSYFFIQKNVKINKMFLFILLYIFLTGSFLAAGFGFFLKVFAVFGVYCWAQLIARELSFLEFINILRSSALFFMIVSVVYVFAFPVQSHEVLQGRDVISSFYGQKNAYGRFLQFSLLLFVFSYYKKPNLRDLLFSLITLILLWVSGSRTAMVVAFFSLLIALWSAKVKNAPVYFMGITLGIIIAVVIGVVFDYIGFFGIGSIYDGVYFYGIEIPLTGRATIWNAISEQLFKGYNWVFGFGLGNFFSTEAGSALADIGLGEFVPDDSHNGYLDLVLNIGALGALLYLVSYVQFLLGIQRLNRFKLFRAFCLTFISMYLLSNLTESYIVKTTNIFFFCFWLLFSYMNRGRNQLL